MEMVVTRLAEGLVRRGHDVGVTSIFKLGPVADLLEASGIRVSLKPALGLRTNLLPLNLSRWFRELRPDVVHIHSGAWLKAARAAWLARIPRVIYTMHGFDGMLPWYEPLLERWAARHTSLTVAVSDAVVPYLTGKVRVDPAKLRVVINGIDVERFRPAAATGNVRRQFGLGEEDIVIGHVARFVPVKNQALLVEAAAAVFEQEPRAFLALVGDGPLRPDIEAHVKRLGIERRVGFLGRVSNLPALYRDFDMFVLSSYSEATSMSILEAMATGVPVVATSVGGTAELLAGGNAGILVPTEDTRALADAMLGLARSRESRERIGEAARRRVEEEYTERSMIDAYERLYAGQTETA